MRQIIFRQQARRELDKAGDWYEKEQIGLGLEFLTEIEKVLLRISRNPEHFPVMFRNVKKAVVQRFPYCIYFRERNQLIVVLAIFHSARNPTMWQRRAM